MSTIFWYLAWHFLASGWKTAQNIIFKEVHVKLSTVSAFERSTKKRIYGLNLVFRTCFWPTLIWPSVIFKGVVVEFLDVGLLFRRIGTTLAIVEKSHTPLKRLPANGTRSSRGCPRKPLIEIPSWLNLKFCVKRIYLLRLKPFYMFDKGVINREVACWEPEFTW